MTDNLKSVIANSITRRNMDDDAKYAWGIELLRSKFFPSKSSYRPLYLRPGLEEAKGYFSKAGLVDILKSSGIVNSKEEGSRVLPVFLEKSLYDNPAVEDYHLSIKEHPNQNLKDHPGYNLYEVTSIIAKHDDS